MFFDVRDVKDMGVKIVDELEPQEFSAIVSDKGVVLCEKNKGAFIVLRSPEEIRRLKSLLDSFSVVRSS